MAFSRSARADAGHGWLHPRERLMSIVPCIAGCDAHPTGGTLGVPPVGQADAGHGWLHPRES